MRTAVVALLLLSAFTGCSQPAGPDAGPETTTPSTATTTASTTTFTLPSSWTTSAPATTTSPTSTGASACGTGRQTADQQDDHTGHQLHILYVLPSDGVDRAYDTGGHLARSFAATNNWLANQTGGPSFRLDTCGGRPDVTFVRIPWTDAEVRATRAYVRDTVEEQIAALGFDDPRKLYLAWYDGSSDWSCGGGAWPPTLVGQVAAMYLRGEPPGAFPCDGNLAPGSPGGPHYLDWAMLHEVLHTLGLVAACAPREHGAGHSDEDPKDLMYQGPLPWEPSILDTGRDDYYGAGIEGCPDLARSVFLEPLPLDAELPPGWP